MISESITKLKHICDTKPQQLEAIEDIIFHRVEYSGKWSKKQILGHLIDSATNNHQRFIRIQYESNPSIYYDQNKWVELHAYQDSDKVKLIHFWEVYNRHLVEVMQLIPPSNYELPCTMRDGSIVTLAFIVNDYVSHLEHHLRQILD